MRIPSAPLLSLALLAGIPAAAQTIERRTVVIAIADDYLAFSDTVSRLDPRARPLAAVSTRRFMARDPSSSILLSPRHADVPTLARAVAVLGRCRTFATDSVLGDQTAIWPGTRPDTTPVPDAERLGRWVAELHAAPERPLRQVADARVRRWITVDDLPVCISPVPMQRGYRPRGSAAPPRTDSVGGGRRPGRPR